MLERPSKFSTNYLKFNKLPSNLRQSINELPSIQNIKILADTLSNEDIPVLQNSGLSQNKVLGMVALLVICLGTILVLPTKEVKSESVALQLPEKVDVPIDEDAVLGKHDESGMASDSSTEIISEFSDKIEVSEGDDETRLELIEEPVVAVQVPPFSESQLLYDSLPHASIYTLLNIRDPRVAEHHHWRWSW